MWNLEWRKLDLILLIIFFSVLHKNSISFNFINLKRGNGFADLNRIHKLGFYFNLRTLYKDIPVLQFKSVN